MSFLQPWMLAALPLMALPIIIHLINQRRYQTIPWAAMMFLLAANRMSRGYARIRQWLILAMRVLAIAGLIFAISRPLISGWLALAGGADATFVLLDRSPSMQQQAAGTVTGKLETGRRQLAETLSLFSSSRWVLVDSATKSTHDLESADALNHVPEVEPTSLSSDLPAMLQAAYENIQANKSGRTEIWICSDLRRNDWDPDSGRWKTLRDAFLQLPQSVRFHLLAYPAPATNNVAVRVTNVRRHETAEQAELLISFRLTQEGTASGSASIPVHFELDGARSELTVEMTGPTIEIQDHRIPLERTQEQGWGKISIPADANPAENEFYFVFSKPAPRQTLLVGEESPANRPLQLAAGISPDPLVQDATEMVAPDQLATVDWEKYALVLWHAPLPEASSATELQAFLDRGGQVIFFPPKEPDATSFLGVQWNDWVERSTPMSIDSWRTDQDLLANTHSGTALPVGQLEIYKYCRMSGDATPLATLNEGVPVISRVATTRGGVYFCATTPAFDDSSLATEGVVLYVFVQRALAAGAELLGNVKDVTAGEVSREQAVDWQPLAVSPDILSTDYAFHSGVYSAGDKLLAVNRSLEEDQAPILADDRVQELFQGLNFTRVDDQAGSRQSLVEEIWRLFFLVLLIALIVESALCLPRLSSSMATSPLARGFDAGPPATPGHTELQPTGGAV